MTLLATEQAGENTVALGFALVVPRTLVVMCIHQVITSTPGTLNLTHRERAMLCKMIHGVAFGALH